MKAYYDACPACLGYDQEQICRAFCRDKEHPFENMVICKQCGCVFRNPVVPSDEIVYAGVGNWGDGSVFKKRFEDLRALFVERNIRLQPGEIHLDIGAGPGWLTDIFHRDNPGVKRVLLEPSPDVAMYARDVNPTATVVPSRLDEAHLPTAAFNLITVCGVDYLFENYRREIDTLTRLLAPNGTIFIERNVFLEMRSWALAPIFDLEDLFGLNSILNVWFAKDQFVEFMSSVFDVVDTVDYALTHTNHPVYNKSEIRGVFCKPKADPTKRVEMKNWYQQNLNQILNLSQSSSIDEVRTILSNGRSRVAIAGVAREAQALCELIKKNSLGQVTSFIAINEQAPSSLQGIPVVDGTKKIDADVILVASVEKQDDYVNALQEQSVPVFACFRNTGFTKFETVTEGGHRLQIKAFLPATVAGPEKLAAHSKQTAGAR